MGSALTKDNLLDRTIPEPNTGCWLWDGYAKKVTDYYFQPRVFHKGKAQSTVRVVWRLFNGNIGTDMHVCHKCDVSLCVNPSHLYLGSHADNMRDLAQRGRGRTRNQKITGYDIVRAKQMRASGMKVIEIAKHFNVTPKAMSRSLNGGRWSALKIGG